jgi:2'-5' RNA ligase
MEIEIMRDSQGPEAAAWLVPDGWYESAVVMSLPQSLRKGIEDMRSRLAHVVRAPRQMFPHFTVCYLGCAQGRQMVRLWRRLAQEPWSVLSVGLDGIKTFESSWGRPENIHLAVRLSPAIREAHDRALSVGRQFSWFQPGTAVGRRYRPHISVFDGIREVISKDIGSRLRWSMSNRMVLRRMSITSLRLDPVVVGEWTVSGTMARPDCSGRRNQRLDTLPQR